MPLSALPPDHIIFEPQTAYCIVSAAHRYSLPVDGLLGILLVEGGKPGMVKSNVNGSKDLGPMQINTIWLGQQSPLYGYVTQDKLTNDLCVNIHSAAWILASELKKAKDIWVAVGRYHAPNNPQNAWRYKMKVNGYLNQAKAVLKQVTNYQIYIQQFFGDRSKDAADGQDD